MGYGTNFPTHHLRAVAECNGHDACPTLFRRQGPPRKELSIHQPSASAITTVISASTPARPSFHLFAHSRRVFDAWWEARQYCRQTSKSSFADFQRKKEEHEGETSGWRHWKTVQVFHSVKLRSLAASEQVHLWSISQRSANLLPRMLSEEIEVISCNGSVLCARESSIVACYIPL